MKCSGWKHEGTLAGMVTCTTSTKEYALNYRNVPHYELEAKDIASTGGWLYSNKIIGRDDQLSILSRLSGDPNVGVGAK